MFVKREWYEFGLGTFLLVFFFLIICLNDVSLALSVLRHSMWRRLGGSSSIACHDGYMGYDQPASTTDKHCHASACVLPVDTESNTVR